MDAYEQIEMRMADKYGAVTTTRKATGDFMLSESHAVNVKSNNVSKQNYSPNMISIKKMHKWVFEDRNNLSFIFVDYKVAGDKLVIVGETKPILIEHIKWTCFSIEAQGYGVIQKIGKIEIDKKQTKSDFYRGFLAAYEKFLMKEQRKHEKFALRFIEDPSTIDW